MVDNELFNWGHYTDWLLAKVNFREADGSSELTNVVWALQNTPFTYILNMDENRAMDGIYLREEYCRNEGADFHSVDDPCTVLEMLCALAIRVTEEYIGDPANPHPEIIFLEMLTNLGLDIYTDDFYRVNPDRAANSVNYILQKWLDREFSYNGDGAIFPIIMPKRDQRDIQIWSQMLEYISEK